mgnify:CR=1 FL=1
MNRVELVGRLTKDVEVTKTPQQTSVARFTVAVNRRFNRDQTDWITCVAWRQTADFLGKYAKKGALVSIEGSIQTSSYDNPTTGQRVYRTEVVVDNANLLESKAVSEARQSNSYNNTYSNNYAPQNNNMGYYADNDPMMDDFSQEPSLDISSDDLPF